MLADDLKSDAPFVIPVGAIESWTDGCWKWLDAVEGWFERMLAGVGEFVTSIFPRWAMQLIRAGIRIGCKLGRVLLFMIVWAVVCIGPFWVCSGAHWLVFMAALVWTVFALVGSGWGLAYARRRYWLRKKAQ